MCALERACAVGFAPLAGPVLRGIQAAQKKGRSKRLVHQIWHELLSAGSTGVGREEIGGILADATANLVQRREGVQ